MQLIGTSGCCCNHLWINHLLTMRRTHKCWTITAYCHLFINLPIQQLLAPTSLTKQLCNDSSIMFPYHINKIIFIVWGGFPCKIRKDAGNIIISCRRVINNTCSWLLSKLSSNNSNMLWRLTCVILKLDEHSQEVLFGLFRAFPVSLM